MSHDPIPFPGKGTRTNKKRRGDRRGMGTTKEWKPKSDRPLTPQESIDKMVDHLCIKLYDESRGSFESREAFCYEYGELVVDHRMVTKPALRTVMLDTVLTRAEELRRVEVISRGRSRSVVQLSDAEYEKQKRRAAARRASQQQKWEERRARKSDSSGSFPRRAAAGGR